MWTDRHTCLSVLFRRTFACKKKISQFFLKLWVTSEKPTYQTWIHARHREAKGVRRWVRAGVDMCAWALALPPAHTRLYNKWLPIGRIDLCTGIAVVQSGLFEFQALVEEARYMKIYLHSYQIQVTIINPCGHAKFKDTSHLI